MSALEFCEYTPSDDLCIVKHLKFYVNSTSTLRRDCDQLLITYNKPHRTASSDHGRWLTETVMTKSGLILNNLVLLVPGQLLLLQLLVKKSISGHHLKCSWLVECSNFCPLLQQATSSSRTEFWWWALDCHSSFYCLILCWASCHTIMLYFSASSS